MVIESQGRYIIDLFIGRQSVPKLKSISLLLTLSNVVVSSSIGIERTVLDRAFFPWPQQKGEYAIDYRFDIRRRRKPSQFLRSPECFI